MYQIVIYLGNYTELGKQPVFIGFPGSKETSNHVQPSLHMTQDFLTDLLLRMYRIGRLRNWTLEQYLSGERIVTVSLSQGLHHRKISCCVVLPIFCKVFLVHWYADEDFFFSHL